MISMSIIAQQWFNTLQTCGMAVHTVDDCRVDVFVKRLQKFVLRRRKPPTTMRMFMSIYIDVQYIGT